jgi:hypothetical protein
MAPTTSGLPTFRTIYAAATHASLLFVLSACAADAGAGRELGDDLGTFRVDASEQSNSCGAGVLGATSEFNFQVELASDALELFWNRQAGGTLDRKLRFDVQARVVVDGETLGVQPVCSIERHDHVWGLMQDSSTGIDRFSGDLTYDFQPAPQAICDGFDQELAGLPVLPCQMRYEIVGQRTRAPESAAARPER